MTGIRYWMFLYSSLASFHYLPQETDSRISTSAVLTCLLHYWRQIRDGVVCICKWMVALHTVHNSWLIKLAAWPYGWQCWSFLRRQKCQPGLWLLASVTDAQGTSRQLYETHQAFSQLQCNPAHSNNVVKWSVRVGLEGGEWMGQRHTALSPSEPCLCPV